MLPRLRGAFSLVFMDENTLYAARDPQGIRPLVLGRLERGWVVATETAALDIVGASFVREVEPGELIVIDEHGLRSQRFAEADAQGLPVRVRLPGPPRHHDRRAQRPRRPASRSDAGSPASTRSTPTWSSRCPESGTPAAIGYAQESGIPFGAGPGQERLRRPHVHPAVADHPAARHPAQAQPAARGHRGQAAGRRRRLDRARQHPARARADAARGRRRRGARAHLQPAGEVAVLLRHRLRHPGRAGRQRAHGRRDPPVDRRRLARLRLPRGAGRGDHRPRGPALPRLLRRRLPGARCPSPSCSASTCSRAFERTCGAAPTPRACPTLVAGGGAADALDPPVTRCRERPGDATPLPVSTSRRASAPSS